MDKSICKILIACVLRITFPKGRYKFLSLFLFSGTSYSVTTDGEPAFLPSEKNVTVHEGDTARLKCRVANLGPKMVNVVGYVLSCVFNFSFGQNIV